MPSDERTRTALLWGYDLDEPSFRHRIMTLVPELERRGWRCRVERIPKGSYVSRVLARRGDLRSADVLILHRIKTSPVELWPLRSFSRLIVYDVDDAIYYRRPRRLGDPPDRSWFRRYKFDRTCAASDLVLAGNRTLAEVARRSGSWVEVVPTPVDLSRYENVEAGRSEPRTVVWIGLPENLVYLELIRPVLARLAPAYPGLRLRVVSSSSPDWTDLPIEAVPWSKAVEIPSLRTAGIGVMPLTDDDWTRGKCAFKLLQYMAAGLPCVGSAVGANLEVVEDGDTGYLANNEAEWERALRNLLDDPDRAARMGRAGRERVRRLFDTRVVVRRVADLVAELDRRKSASAA